MARIRSVKPEFWVDEKVVDLSPWARLLFIGMWNFADDQGYIDFKPRRIKMQILPGDDVDVDALIAELIGSGRIKPYASPVGLVLHIVNWHHQRVDKPGKPRFEQSQLTPVDLPSPPLNPPPTAEPAPAFVEPSGSPRESSPADLEGIRRGSGVPLTTFAGGLASPPRTALAVVPDPGPEPRAPNEIVAWWIDRCIQRPAKQVVGQIAKHVKELADQGFQPIHIRTGISEWAAKEVHPSVLPSIVSAVANRGAPIRAAPAQPTRTELTLAANQQVAQQLRAVEGGP